MAQNQKGPSDDLLKLTVTRAGDFLRGMIDPAVFYALQGIGFSEKEYNKGWQLYDAVSGLPKELPFPTGLPADNESLLIFKEIDEWDDTNLPIINSVLLEVDQDVLQLLFREDIEPKQGAESVTVIKKLAERVINLYDHPDPNRAHRRDADLAALKALEEHGYSRAEFERLLGLIGKLTSDAPDPAPTPIPLPLNEEELRQKRLTLYYWYDKWVTIIQKRKLPSKYLRPLGLTKLGRPRKQAQSNSPKKKKKEKASEATLPPTVASD